ncbi:hypothetical protein PGT21_017080 [Puccinia graminis f. sp. tritici]|uniref:START domain-containing protein n=1 Tax=Puccinia graminis f. sp. tritici TaxID=56615 RepID=A0A5B0PEI7_PUCGR|nr:hypothetical protein PGTUg99_024301 [Puccinia graminis f. sp. tritici]KAA1099681.1 hypothetical protein PGT21_017080 [Puccinia graminis f. sp. tritici]
MANNELVQHRQTSNRHLLFLLSLSLLPIYTFTRSRWIPRLGLDQIHLILLQLIFTYFFSQRFSSKSASRSTNALEEDNILVEEEEEVEGKKKKKKIDTSDCTTVGIAKSLRELVDRPSDWTNVFPTPGIEILRHRTISSLYAVRTEFEEDHSLTMEQLIRCIRESKQWEWDRMCECGEDLGDGVTWVRLKGFWPIKPKELVMRSCMFRLPGPDNGSRSVEDPSSKPPIRILAASSSTTHPLKKSTLEIKFAGYLIEQLSSSSGLRVTQIVDLSGFGALPTFVIKAIVCKFVPSSLRKLVGLAQRLPPLPPPTSPITEGSGPSWMPPILMNESKIGGPSVGSKPSTESQRLKLEIDQLKKIINDLQNQKDKNKSPFLVRPAWIDKFNHLSLASVVGTSMAICLSFAIKKRLANRREKKDLLYLVNDWAPDDLVFLLEFLSRKRE